MPAGLTRKMSKGKTLHDQITIAGASGSATGRNIHQKDLASALRMTKAISSITYGGHGVDAALSVYNGESDSVDGRRPRELLTDNAVAITIVHVSIGRVTSSYRGDTVRPCLWACNSPVAVVIP